MSYWVWQCPSIGVALVLVAAALRRHGVWTGIGAGAEAQGGVLDEVMGGQRGS